MKAHRGIS